MRACAKNKRAQSVVRKGAKNSPLTTKLSPGSTMDTIAPLIELFRPAFSAPSFENFRFLMLAWLQCGEAKISRMLRSAARIAGLMPKHRGAPKHFSVFYRFFSRAKWSLDTLGAVMARAFEARLGDEVVVLVDDTVFRRTGPRILGAGVHYDPLSSTYSGTQGRKTRYCFGLRFVVVAVFVPFDWMRSGGIAIPVLFRLYRSPKTCSEDEHTKFTVLAARLIAVVEGWWSDKQLVVVGDRDYSCQTVLECLEESTQMVGRLPMDARLCDPDFEQTPGPGRPRKWGPRLAAPKQWAEDTSQSWRRVRVYIYGRQVCLLVKVLQAQWMRAPAERTLTVVLTRDPKGRLDDACFFRTQADCSVEQVLIPMSLRWTLEGCFRDVKQHLRLEEVQNGFSRGSERADTTRPGPQADRGRTPRASRRTIPVGMLAYGLVVLWYLDHGKPVLDLKRARLMAPWYTQKTTLSVGDMLRAFRRQMEREGFSNTRTEGGFDENKLHDEVSTPLPKSAGGQLPARIRRRSRA